MVRASDVHMSGGATIADSGVVSLTTLGIDGVTGLGAATIPQFVYRTGSNTYGGLFLGTSQHQYDSYNGQVEAANGTTGTLDTVAGPFVKISRTGGPVNTACVGANPVDSECDATLAVYANGTAGSTVQTTAIYGAAMSSGTTEPGADAIGVTGSGRSVNASTGIGTGAYLEGRRDNATGAALGAEIRTENDLASTACGYNTTGIGVCDGIWVTSTGAGTDNDLSTALHVAAVTNGIYRWHAGVTINAGSVSTYGIDNESSSTYGLYDNGTHTYAFVSGAAAGNVGIGTLTPTQPLDVIGPIRSSQMFLVTSGVPTLSACGGGTPTANGGSTNAAGSFTTGTGGTVTACTVTFATAYPNNAFCTVTPASATTTSVYISSQTNTAFTVTFAPATASQPFQYVCGGR